MKNKKIKIIAEIGWNHMGEMSLAKKMIKSAAVNGADMVKLQTWSEKNLKTGPWDNDGRREIYKKAELHQSDYLNLKKFSKKHNIELFTSLFNIKDYNKIKLCKFKTIKIPSHEIYNLDLIDFCLKKFKVVLVSTGASKWDEIKKITKLKNFKKKAYLMHCVSSYPSEPNMINMPRLEKIKKLTKKIGFSGHYKGIDDALIAISMGSLYIEKHFTINNNLPGRDNKFALLPDDLKRLSIFRDNYSKMTIYKGLNLQKSEYDIFQNYRGRWGK
ncbi:N-acetylneuraminate synthase family protein [Candidatus Pelagibacter sp.]|nr:N-acetylneuraminate synthase family protein [Candidatus Pelagibacter sp.]